MAVKIRLKRLGKIRVPQYRIVVVDSRKKRDGRVLEEIGKYHPKEDPSYIDVESERAQYWLGVGAQPTEPVEQILKVTGDWQKFKGLPGAEGTLKSKDAKRDKIEIFNEALKEAAKEPKGDAVTKKAAAKKERREDPPRRLRLPLLRPRRLRPRPPRRPPLPRKLPLPRFRPRFPPTRPPRVPPRPLRRPGGRRERRRRQERVLMLDEAFEHLVKGMVDAPRRGRWFATAPAPRALLEVRVNPEDLGRVIGRGGRTATAFRTVLSALAGRGGPGSTSSTPTGPELSSARFPVDGR